MDESSDDLGTVQIPTSWRGGKIESLLTIIVISSSILGYNLWTLQENVMNPDMENCTTHPAGFIFASANFEHRL